MKNKATKALLEMGMPARIKGFDYIVSAMCLFDEDAAWKHKITAMYWKIAQQYDSTYTRVERCIRHAFEIVLSKGDLEVVEKYLTFHNTTNGNLLTTLYLKLLQEGENEKD